MFTSHLESRARLNPTLFLKATESALWVVYEVGLYLQFWCLSWEKQKYHPGLFAGDYDFCLFSLFLSNPGQSSRVVPP